VYVPYVLLTFASLEFFSVETPEEQLLESCTAVAFFADGLPISPTAIPIETFEGDVGVAHYSYDTNLVIDPANTNCFDATEGGKLDLTVWGPGGSEADLLEAFNGAHFGMAFGPHTEYILAAFGDDTLADPDFMDSTFTEFIAINDSTGAWNGVDWSFGSLFVWDEATQEVEVNGTTLTRQPIGAF
jgi:hypothetical protein